MRPLTHSFRLFRSPRSFLPRSPRRLFLRRSSRCPRSLSTISSPPPPPRRPSPSPPPRTQVIYVFGGVRGGNEMWCLETSTRRWSRRSDKTGRVPKPRFGHCAATIGTSIYVFAGHDGKKSLNDLYKFDTSTNVWSDMGRYVTWY